MNKFTVKLAWNLGATQHAFKVPAKDRNEAVAKAFLVARKAIFVPRNADLEFVAVSL